MPEIDLGDWESGLDFDTSRRVLAVMLFPKDADRRENFVKDSAAMRSLYTKADTSERDILVSLVDMDEPGPRQKGVIAGEILFAVRTIAERHPKYEASVNKAIYIVWQRLKHINESQGERWSTGRSFIREAWRSYKSVSHLWAARTRQIKRRIDLERALGNLSGADDKSSLSDPEVLRFMLSTSEDMRRWGEKHVTRNGAPTLDQVDMWACPADLSLPEIGGCVPAFQNDDMKSLIEYKASDQT